ncbi:recombinase family protein [Sorangium sp. So ce1128]
MSTSTDERRGGAAVASTKIAARHLDRLAVVYVRQSTPHQLLHHQESTRLQYNLTERAVALGWARERVLIMDDDLGRSGSNSEGRPGFQRLVAEVGLDHVGMILGLEMSRLARSCADWHQPGLVRCGRCGHRMAVQYSSSYPRYGCIEAASAYAGPSCQSIAAAAVDRVVEALLLRALEPSALEVSMAVVADLERERAREEQLWQQRLERARYDVERARRQYDAVEPENRLVARTLERTLEERLGAEQKVQEDYRRSRAARPATLSEVERAAIRALATELPKLWNSPTTTNEQRKEVVRQLLEEARLSMEGESERVELTVRWAGGHETTTTLGGWKR